MVFLRNSARASRLSSGTGSSKNNKPNSSKALICRIANDGRERLPVELRRCGFWVRGSLSLVNILVGIISGGFDPWDTQLNELWRKHRCACVGVSKYPAPHWPTEKPIDRNGESLALNILQCHAYRAEDGI